MNNPVLTDSPARTEIARLTARMLLEIKAVHLGGDEPFTFTSGLASPVYTDCRKIISYPRVRTALMDFAVERLMHDAGYEAFDAIAGGETAGIPFAAWIADRLGLPMQYVRKKPKGFGRDAQIEGDISDGQRVLLVEDLTTDGGSKLRFVDAIRKTGASCNHTLVVFYYDIFKDTPKKLADHDLSLHYLATWWDVLEVCRSENRFDTATLDQVESFLNDPLGWSEKNGGSYQPTEAGRAPVEAG